MPTDTDLLARLRQRDPDAFAELFAAHSDRLYRLALHLLDDPTEAEGVVQDTFLKLFNHLDHFEGRSTLGTWLYRVAYNASYDRLRQRRPTLSLDAPDDDDESLPMPIQLADWTAAPEARFTTRELQHTLTHAIRSLPETLRVVFVLREVEGASTQECATILNLTPGAVKVRLHRARLLLRETLAAEFATTSAAHHPAEG